MARIRSIKPEFWVSEQVVECSTNARLLFVGMWNFCDDHGRHKASVKALKAEVFPMDSFGPDDILEWVMELLAVELIDCYETKDGVKFWQVTGWNHQKIDKKQRAKFPEPSESIRIPFDERSSKKGQFVERSTNVRHGWKDRMEGSEGKGKEGSSSLCTDVPKAERSVPDDSEPILEYPCNGKVKTWWLRQSVVDRLQDAYPGVDIVAEAKKAHVWVLANPNRAKTAGGMFKYLNGWMAKANDGYRGNGRSAAETIQEQNERAIEEGIRIAAERKRQRELAK